MGEVKGSASLHPGTGIPVEKRIPPLRAARSGRNDIFMEEGIFHDQFDDTP
jgi:hypothetical protein